MPRADNGLGPISPPEQEVARNKNEFSCNAETTISLIKLKTLADEAEITIIQAITNKNKIGITRKEETMPGVYLGEGIVISHEFTGVVSIIDTTEEPVEIKTPHAILDTIEGDDAETVNTTYRKENEDEPSLKTGQEELRRLPRTKHLNREERTASMEICDGFCEKFF
jgi:hypothetical protein